MKFKINLAGLLFWPALVFATWKGWVPLVYAVLFTLHELQLNIEWERKR